MKDLIADAHRFLKENYVAGDSLLTSKENNEFFRKTKPIIKKEEPKVQKLVKAPVPMPAPEPKIQKEIKPQIPERIAQAPASFDPMKEMRALVQRAAPNFRLRETVLDDAVAKQPAAAATLQAALISYGEKDQSLLFLTHLAQAIDICLIPAELIDGQKMEKEKKWEGLLQTSSLKWVIAPCRMIGKSPELTRHYREIPATSERFLGNVPILFLSPIADYFKNPGLKRDLWKTLCQILKS